MRSSMNMGETTVELKLTKGQRLPQKIIGRGFLMPVFAIIMTGFVAALCQEQSQTSIPDLQKEAASWQQKIKDMEERIAKTDASTIDEVNAFREYLRAEAVHKADFQAQNDSLSADIAMARRRVDSLEQSAENRKLGAATADNRVEEMRLALLAACRDLKEFVNSLPPSNIRTASATLDFLKGELESKTVTVSEALERYWQILGVLEDAETSMDTYAAASPVAGLPGQAYFVRIGLAYLAVVSEEGKTAALWVSEGAKEGEWRPVMDLFAKSALWDAVRIRDRKIVPRIVDLPFDHPCTVKNEDEAEKSKRGPQQ